MQRRTYLSCAAASAATVGLAGCLSDAEESGTVSYPDDSVQNIDVEEGETLEVEIENEEGIATFVTIDDPDDQEVAEAEIETEDTITHTAEQSGRYRVWIMPDDTASYEIFIED